MPFRLLRPLPFSDSGIPLRTCQPVDENAQKTVHSVRYFIDIELTSDIFLAVFDKPAAFIECDLFGFATSADYSDSFLEITAARSQVSLIKFLFLRRFYKMVF